MAHGHLRGRIEVEHLKRGKPKRVTNERLQLARMHNVCVDPVVELSGSHVHAKHQACRQCASLAPKRGHLMGATQQVARTGATTALA